MKRFFAAFVLSMVFVLIVGSAQSATIVFVDDFSSGVASAEFSGEGFINSVEGYAGLNGFADNFLVNDTNPSVNTTLSLSGLVAHTEITLTFDLALIDSWDGDGAGPPSQDYFNVELDGAEIFEISVDNAQGIEPEIVPPTATNRIGPTELIGRVGSFYNDSGFAVSLTVPHSSPTATFDFFADGAGWQGGFALDESWAIDTIQITSNAVPVPGAAWLFVSAFGLLGWMRRRTA